MKLKQIYDTIDGYAPFALSEEFIARGSYDNSGVLLDCGEEVTGVLFSLDLSARAVEEAKREGCNCIVTHHPAIWQAVKRITPEGTPDLALLVKHRISVVSAHLNLDAAEEGIDVSLMRALGGVQPIAVMDVLSAGGYGRVYDRASVPFAQFVGELKTALSTERVITYGTAPVCRVASFCGAGFSPDALAFALSHGADTIVSADARHHLIAEAVERGLNVVLLTHYASEAYGFSAFYRAMQGKLSCKCALFVDETLM